MRLKHTLRISRDCDLEEWRAAEELVCHRPERPDVMRDVRWHAFVWEFIVINNLLACERDFTPVNKLKSYDQIYHQHN